ncbi:carbohydrate kinase [Clavulina sp. PMI_390]|nr:carbohydrate kinase [Clavulina sp. PMI_390]
MAATVDSALIIVMGVSGCGKSTTGEALAKTLNVPFLDGDALHPQSNVDKMSVGIPLTDADRAPWLARIRATALSVTGKDTSPSSESEPMPKIVVIGCSALRLPYRDVLRGVEEHPSVDSNPTRHEGLDPTSQPDTKPLAPHSNLLKTFFVWIDGPRDVLLSRMTSRKGHFMKESMLDSQLATLERPDGEADVVKVDLEAQTDVQVQMAIEGLRERPSIQHPMASNGKPEAEVIVEFQDGLSYNKKRLEEAFASGAFEAPARKPKEAPHGVDIKKDHLELLIKEFEITKAQAEKALVQHKGDLTATINTLVAPPQLPTKAE